MILNSIPHKQDWLIHMASVVGVASQCRRSFNTSVASTINAVKSHIILPTSDAVLAHDSPFQIFDFRKLKSVVYNIVESHNLQQRHCQSW